MFYHDEFLLDDEPKSLADEYEEYLEETRPRGPGGSPIVYTQGGGSAEWSDSAGCYLFVEPPDWWKECKPGDRVPEEWGIA